MDKKTMGGFIAALRKSKGMTQQEVADQLHVSNKTVSKWERDEGYPEVMMIPAIAELFDVTTDEILRGERVVEKKREMSDQKSEQRRAYLKKRAQVQCKNICTIAFAILLFGLILQFTVAYAFYKPALGFGLLSLSVVAAIILCVIKINTLHSNYIDQDMFEAPTKEGTQHLRFVYKNAAFVIGSACFVFFAGLPFVLFRTGFRDSVITFETYMIALPVVLLVSIALNVVGRYVAKRRIAARYYSILSPSETAQRKRLHIRFFLVIFAIVSIFIATYIAFSTHMSQPVAQQFETRAAFDSYIADWQTYLANRDEAEQRGAMMMHPEDEWRTERHSSIRIEQEQQDENGVFQMVGEYERITSIDDSNLTIYRRRPMAETAQIQNTISASFFTLIAIAVIAWLIFYTIGFYKIKPDEAMYRS